MISKASLADDVFVFLGVLGVGLLLNLGVAPSYLALFFGGVLAILVPIKLASSLRIELQQQAQLSTPRLTVCGVRNEFRYLQGYRFLVLHLDIHAELLARKRLSIEILFFEGVDGQEVAVGSRLARYRNHAGVAAITHRTHALAGAESAHPSLWLSIPLRAFTVPPGQVECCYQAQVRVTEETTGVESVRTHPVSFQLEPADRLPTDQPLEVASPGEPEPIRSDEEPALCNVCGDEMHDSIRHCPVCGTPAHPDCWTYFGGCAVYACQGAPRRM